MPVRLDRLRFAGSGAVAGAFSAFTFTLVHGLTISDIWLSLPAMLAAGALSGASLGWSDALVAGPEGFCSRRPCSSRCSGSTCR